MRFWEFYRIISRRKSLIITVVIATLVITFFATQNKRTEFVAAANIMPTDAVLQRPILWRINTDSGEREAPQEGNREAQLANLMSLITSRTVAERTIEMLGLDMEPDDLQKDIKVSRIPSPSSDPRGGMETDIIQILVASEDPEQAVNLANGISAVFANYYQEISHENALANARFLEEELVRSEANLDRAQARLKRYKISKGISALPEGMQATIAGYNALQQQRDEAMAQLAETRQRLANIRQQLRKVSPTRTVMEGTTDSPAVQQLETQLATFKGRLVEAQAKYTDAHPVVQDLKKSVADAQGRLEVERSKVKMHKNVVANPIHQTLLQQESQLQSDALGLAARVAKLDGAVARAKSGFIPGGDVEVARLQQEFLDAQAQASNIRQKLHQARLDEKDTSATGAIRLVDKAMTAEAPPTRSRASYMMMGFVLSLIFGVGAALMMESLDNRIKTNVDVEQLLSLPVNALIPSMERKGMPALPTVTYLDPLSPIAEAFRFLRTDLLLTAAESGVKSVMVATAKPGQGGTTTVANLAIALAMDGKKVILVDADLRRPCQHGIFRIPNDIGLSNVLAENMPVEDVMMTTEIENLTIIPGGPTPLNPSELLGSERMRDVVESLEEKADFVLFDTPSAIAFTDTIVMTKWIDGVLMVVRANQVARGAELQVRNLFNRARVRILGVVLNDVEPTGVDSYYYHSHYYPTGSPTPSQPRLALQGGKGGFVSDE